MKERSRNGKNPELSAELYPLKGRIQLKRRIQLLGKVFCFYSITLQRSFYSSIGIFQRERFSMKIFRSSYNFQARRYFSGTIFNFGNYRTNLKWITQFTFTHSSTCYRFFITQFYVAQCMVLHLFYQPINMILLSITAFYFFYERCLFLPLSTAKKIKYH